MITLTMADNYYYISKRLLIGQISRYDSTRYAVKDSKSSLNECKMNVR